jgi:hypothetical protein
MLKPGGRDFETESVLSWTTGDETRIISCEACTAAKANCSKSLAIRIQTLGMFRYFFQFLHDIITFDRHFVNKFLLTTTHPLTAYFSSLSVPLSSNFY